MKAAITTFILTALLTIPAGARIGETRAECIARYGEPASTPDETSMVFRMGDFGINATFGEDGKAIVMVYVKAPRDAIGNWTRLSATEIETILSANAGDGEWRKLDDPLNERWANDDAGLYATYDPVGGMLNVFTRAFAEAVAEEKAEREREALRDF